MSALINRVPTGRIVSLLAELKYLVYRFGSKPFTLNDMKFDANSAVTQLDFFPLVISHPEYGKHDPYLDNILSKAGFHLTQSKQYDTQKSKSVSECMNALEGLGWAIRLADGRGILSRRGTQLARLKYSDENLFLLLRRSVLGYGPFVGLLYKCQKEKNLKSNTVRRNKVQIGYINTNETVKVGSSEIPISTGSQRDSIIRTRSALFAWAMTTGFIWPIAISRPPTLNQWHIKALDLLKDKGKNWGWGEFNLFIPKSLFAGKHFVEQPLSYRWMTKSTKALRERGQESVRQISLSLEHKIKNRRFAIVYLLGLAAKRNQRINFDKLIVELAKYPDLFVVNSAIFRSVMDAEKDIAITAGIPFQEEKKELAPLTKIDLEVVAEGASKALVQTLCKVYTSITR